MAMRQGCNSISLDVFGLGISQRLRPHENAPQKPPHEMKYYSKNTQWLTCGLAVQTDHTGTLLRSDWLSHVAARAILRSNAPLWSSRLPDHMSLSGVLAFTSHYNGESQQMVISARWQGNIGCVIQRVICQTWLHGQISLACIAGGR